MDETIEIRDADGNVVRIRLYSTLHQIADHCSKRLAPGSSTSVVSPRGAVVRISMLAPGRGETD